MKLRLFCVAMIAAVALAAPGKPRAIKLKQGAPIFGEVLGQECRQDKLVVRDVRSGRKITVTWDKVDPEHARELRIELGFEVDTGPGVLQIDGHKILNRAGVTFEGKLMNEATAERDGYYALKTPGRVLKIKLADVRRGPDPVTLNALQVYTFMELYEKRMKTNPPTDAEGHFRIAEFARSVGALEQAKIHYEKVLTFENAKYHPDTIKRQIERVDKLLSQKDAVADLREIKQAIIFNKFDLATERITAFKEKYKDEELQKEAADLETERDDKRTEYFIQQVTRRLPRAVKSVIVEKLKEKELSLSDARRYAGAEPSTEISASAHAVDRVAEKMKLEPEEVLAFWAKRNEERRRPVQKAFYRDGTFIIVESLQDPLAKAPKVKRPKGGSRRGGGRAAAPRPRPQLRPDQWWERMRAAKKTTVLRDFLFAWWVDNAGMTIVLEPKDSVCPTCNGRGYTAQSKMTSEGTIPYFDRCGACHSSTFYRVVKWR